MVQTLNNFFLFHEGLDFHILNDGFVCDCSPPSLRARFVNNDSVLTETKQAETREEEED